MNNGFNNERGVSVAITGNTVNTISCYKENGIRKR